MVRCRAIQTSPANSANQLGDINIHLAALRDRLNHARKIRITHEGLASAIALSPLNTS
jgi:hypothetical protein